MRRRFWWYRFPKTLDMRQFTPLPSSGYLVGGAVRDTLLGAAVKDLDWLVVDPKREATEAAQHLNATPVLLDAHRNHWRVASAELAMIRDYAPFAAADLAINTPINPVINAPAGVKDAVKPEATPGDALLTDLKRRDFTLNALAVDLRGRVHDPLGGVQQLRRKQLQMVSRQNLLADPLRVLRGVRLACSRELTILPETLAVFAEVAALHAAGQLPLPAGERSGEELSRLLLSAKAGRGLKLLERTGLLGVYLPELAATAGTAQGGFHHLDVLDHSIEALHQLLYRFPDAPLALRWATLLHDIGKPECQTGAAGEPSQHFYGHDQRGAELASTLLKRLRQPAALYERVAALIGAHMVQLPTSEREAKRFAHRRRALLPDLLKLMLADREAARGPLSSAKNRERYQMALAMILEGLEPPQKNPPLLDGKEIMTLLNLSPGPRIGEALRFIEEAAALGDIRSKEEAVRALHAYAQAQGWQPSEALSLP